MFRTRLFVLIAVILVAMPAAMQAALIDTNTGTTMWSDSFETGTVGSAPLTTEPQAGTYGASAGVRVKIADAASAGFPAYEGTKFMTVSRLAEVDYIIAKPVAGSSVTGHQLELTLPFYVSQGAGAIRFLQNDTYADILMSFTFYGSGTNTGKVLWLNMNPTNGNGFFTQTFTPNAWNVLVVDHINGTNNWSVSINGQTAETAIGTTTFGLNNVTGFAVVAAASPSAISVDGVIPEPSTTALLVTGLAGLLAVWKKR